VLTINELMAIAPGLEWLSDPSKRKLTAHRLTDCQYIAVRNRGAQDGLWKINGRRQAIYARADLTFGQREDAAAAHREKLNSTTKP